MTKEQATTPALPVNIDQVLDRLDDIIERSVKANNFVCVFAFVYWETTLEIKNAIDAGEFEDPQRMERMDVIFANLFIKAFDDHQAGNTTPKAWQFAFTAANEKLSLVQHSLLGMNAHINLDLSISAAEAAKEGNILDLKNDFMSVNSILADLVNPMQRGLGKVSLMMKLLDVFGFRQDEKIIDFSIKKARDFSWLNAVELSLMNDKTKKKRIDEIDLRVLELSKIIKQPPGRLVRGILKFISLFEPANPAKIISKMRNA